MDKVFYISFGKTSVRRIVKFTLVHLELTVVNVFLSVSKFWTRNRLGDRMRDKYNLNILDTEDDAGE